MKIIIKRDSKVLAEILAAVRSMEEGQVRNMATVQEQLDSISKALDDASTALENIAADEAAQTKAIKDLQDIINAGGVITAEQLQPLVDKAQGVQKKAQDAADSIPDQPPSTP